ncbi:beta-ketoacyl synthase [Gammaproteobacteria bacterium]|nr:beta-ketoacyl synthase [Gammaproteobacteria bacterium]
MTQRRTPLPVIVGSGGINPAGRVSFNHAYRRMVLESLPQQVQQTTLGSLAKLMELAKCDNDVTKAQILDGTLVRKIEHFDVKRIAWNNAMSLGKNPDSEQTFIVAKRQLPQTLPEDWRVTSLDDKHALVRCVGDLNVLVQDLRPSRVTSAGQLPTGFDPAALYPSRSHPRGLQMTVYGASDALRSTGFSIDELKSLVRPDQFAVYSGSAMGQLDQDGYGGLMQNALAGKRTTAKNIALGLPEMPGDFVNAYVLGSVGETAGIIGACATFLYNVKRGMDEIRSGSKRIVMVGNAEAPITPSVIEGYRTMGALAEDEALMALDGSATPDNRRACRPFSDNAGFTLAESSVWIVLMDDALAMESGARILGSVGDVFVNADGYKKSIPGPGIGNYITVAKAMASARTMLGEEGLRHSTYMHAHGTSTPQNRVTESAIMSELAQAFDVPQFTIAAIKSYLGHSLAPAGGDQLAAILGAWQDGIIPGIKTIDHIADDVAQDRLHFPMRDQERDMDSMRGAFVNSKGFGGNNATGFFMSPQQTEQMLEKRYGTKALTAAKQRQEAIEQKAQTYNDAADNGDIAPVYQFGEGVLESSDLKITDQEITVPGFAQKIRLSGDNPFEDMS